MTERYVSAITEAWNTAGIDYCILRNYENLPHDMGNDLDVLIDPRALSSAESIAIKAITGAGGIVHNRAEFSPVSLFFHDAETKTQLHLDLFRNLTWRGADILPVKEVLENKRVYNGFPVPGVFHEGVLNLLTRLLYGGYIKDKYKPQVAGIFNDHQAECTSLLEAVLGKKLGGNVFRQVLCGEWDHIEKSIGTVRTNLQVGCILRNPLRYLSVLFLDFIRLLLRWIKLPGVSIVLVGPDGCGKTSVGVELQKRLAGTFYEEYVQHLHWKPRLLKGMADAAKPFGTPCTDPHGKPGRNPIMNSLYFLAHSLEIPPAWLLRVRPRLFRNMLVMIDRYYYDFMVDSKRYRMNVSEKWAWFMYRFMPKPDLVFCLTAPTEVIQARKREVSPEETERQCRAYEKVAGRLPYGHVVDTNRPLDQVVDEVEAIVLQYLAERTKRRGKSFYH